MPASTRQIGEWRRDLDVVRLRDSLRRMTSSTPRGEADEALARLLRFATEEPTASEALVREHTRWQTFFDALGLPDADAVDSQTVAVPDLPLRVR